MRFLVESKPAWKTMDERITSALSNMKELRTIRIAAYLLAHSGDSVIWITLALALYLLIESWHRPILILTVTYVVAVIFILLVKPLLKRERPAEHSEFQKFHGPDKHSFPSGHATRVGAVVVVAAFLNISTLPFVLTWAILVSLARVIVGAHWFSDVAAGFFFGLLIGLASNVLATMIL